MLLGLTMALINLVTYNARGLNTSSKRYKVYKELHHYVANVKCLIGTHITHASRHRLTSHLFPMWFYGNSTLSRSQGVAIEFDRSSVFVLKEQQDDPEGRFSIKGRIFNMELTIGNIFPQNREPNKFLKKTLKRLMVFKEKGNSL